VREVQTPVGLDRDLDHSLDRREVGNVDFDEGGVPAGVLDQFDRLTTGIIFQSLGDDVSADPRETKVEG
jgi:hypothetical protein